MNQIAWGLGSVAFVAIFARIGIIESAAALAVVMSLVLRLPAFLVVFAIDRFRSGRWIRNLVTDGRIMSRMDEDRIAKTVDLAAPVSAVWRALTDHREFGQWFRVRLDGPFEVGATTTGKLTYPGHEDVDWVSITERMEHERVFAFSWPPGAVDPDTNYNASDKIVVEFRLEPSELGTRLNISETGFLQFPEAKRMDVIRSNSEGWNIQADNIAAHVAE